MRRKPSPVLPDVEPTRRYQPPADPYEGEESSPYRLETDDPADESPYGDAPYDEPPYPDTPYDADEFYDEDEYSDYHEELDDAHRLHVAMNVLDVASVLVGCVCIFVLVTLLISLFNWLSADIAHGLSQFGSTLQ